MEARIVNSHPSVIIVTNGDEVLTAGYNQTYKPAYRGRANPIGGNPRPNLDRSPLDTLRRELGDELFPGEIKREKGTEIVTEKLQGEIPRNDKVRNFASAEKILALRDSLLENYRGVRDYFVQVPLVPGGSKQPYNAIYSVYSATLPDRVFNMVRKNLEEGFDMTNEGLLMVRSLDDLVKGNPLLAHSAGPIFADFFDLLIPNPEDVKIERLGDIRDSYMSYIADSNLNYQVKSLEWLKEEVKK